VTPTAQAGTHLDGEEHAQQAGGHRSHRAGAADQNRRHEVGKAGQQAHAQDNQGQGHDVDAPQPQAESPNDGQVAGGGGVDDEAVEDGARDGAHQVLQAPVEHPDPGGSHRGQPLRVVNGGADVAGRAEDGGDNRDRKGGVERMLGERLLGTVPQEGPKERLGKEDERRMQRALIKKRSVNREATCLEERLG